MCDLVFYSFIVLG